MTNQEKAGRLAGKYFDGRRQKGTFQMAKSLLIEAMKWKDTKLKKRLEELKEIRPTTLYDWRDVELRRAVIDEIINKLWEEKK